MRLQEMHPRKASKDWACCARRHARRDEAAASSGVPRCHGRRADELIGKSQGDYPSGVARRDVAFCRHAARATAQRPAMRWRSAARAASYQARLHACTPSACGTQVAPLGFARTSAPRDGMAGQKTKRGQVSLPHFFMLRCLPCPSPAVWESGTRTEVGITLPGVSPAVPWSFRVPSAGGTSAFRTARYAASVRLPTQPCRST